MTIIAIHEENHGHIATATTMKAAFQYLFKHGWIDEGTEFLIGDDWTTLKLIIEAECGEYTEEYALFWCLENAENWELWDGLFYFHYNELIEEED
jgi:hypothetical protein